MQEWLKISLQLCTYGLFNGMNLFEPFMYKYLTEFSGISPQNVSDFFIAQLTYWNLFLLAIIFLITDMFRYKPLIILSVLSGLSSYSIVRWSEGLWPLMVRTETLLPFLLPD